MNNQEIDNDAWKTAQPPFSSYIIEWVQRYFQKQIKHILDTGDGSQKSKFYTKALVFNAL